MREKTIISCAGISGLRPGVAAGSAATEPSTAEQLDPTLFGEQRFPVGGSIIGPGVDQITLVGITSRRRDRFLARDPGPSPQPMASRCENLAAQGYHPGGFVHSAKGSRSNAEAAR
jgi:hypothetical protein